MSSNLHFYEPLVGPKLKQRGGKGRKNIPEITLSQSFSQILPPALFHWTFSVWFCTYILEHFQCMFCTKAWKMRIFLIVFTGVRKLACPKAYIHLHVAEALTKYHHPDRPQHRNTTLCFLWQCTLESSLERTTFRSIHLKSISDFPATHAGVTSAIK